MNKTISLAMMAFLLIGTLGFVVAEEASDDIAKAERVGFFANQMYKVKYAFTFDKERKIDLALEMAERRLAEAELLSEDNPEAYEKAQERYDDLLARAEEILKDMESENDGENGSVEYMEKIARIQNKFERHMDHSDEIYARALERFEANNASEEKIERFEMFHERAVNRITKMEKRALEKRSNAILKHKALSNMSDDDLEDLLERIDEDEGLTEAREKRLEQARERIAELEENGLGNFEGIKKRLEYANLSEEKMARAEDHFERMKDRTEEARERIKERLEEQMRLSDDDDSDDNESDSDDNDNESDSDDDSGSDDNESDSDDDSGSDDQVACTMDALECSDGSFVGRVAPDCEFSACPVDAISFN